MATITATGTPVKHPELGEIKIVVIGDMVDIDIASFYTKQSEVFKEDDSIKRVFDEDLKKGPSYPLCAEPFTMRCALFVLFEWFGEAESCWVTEPEHVKLDGEIEPMESKPGVIY